MLAYVIDHYLKLEHGLNNYTLYIGTPQPNSRNYHLVNCYRVFYQVNIFPDYIRNNEYPTTGFFKYM